jgi:hypothetical protein
MYLDVLILIGVQLIILPALNRVKKLEKKKNRRELQWPMIN